MYKLNFEMTPFFDLFFKTEICNLNNSNFFPFLSLKNDKKNNNENEKL